MVTRFRSVGHRHVDTGQNYDEERMFQPVATLSHYLLTLRRKFSFWTFLATAASDAKRFLPGKREQSFRDAWFTEHAALASNFKSD